jgi:prepilin-type N-terminal cleavage/methylation domain-containing protein
VTGATNRRHSSGTRVRERAAGFTLIEMMVALAIASVLLVALTVLFINTSAARTETDRASRQIEAGRFALGELADDIRHAGYYGAIINAPTFAGASLPIRARSWSRTSRATWDCRCKGTTAARPRR